jgi:hypothetical protein
MAGGLHFLCGEARMTTQVPTLWALIASRAQTSRDH